MKADSKRVDQQNWKKSCGRAVVAGEQRPTLSCDASFFLSSHVACSQARPEARPNQRTDKLHHRLGLVHMPNRQSRTLT